MVLKRGENVGDRFVRQTSEHEVLELIVSGTRQTALTADQALSRETAGAPAPQGIGTSMPNAPGGSDNPPCSS